MTTFNERLASDILKVLETLPRGDSPDHPTKWDLVRMLRDVDDRYRRWADGGNVYRAIRTCLYYKVHTLDSGEVVTVNRSELSGRFEVRFFLAATDEERRVHTADRTGDDRTRMENTLSLSADNQLLVPTPMNHGRWTTAQTARHLVTALYNAYEPGSSAGRRIESEMGTILRAITDRIQQIVEEA